MTVYRAGRRRPLPRKNSFKKVSKKEEMPREARSDCDTNDLESLMAKFQEHIDMFQYEEARSICERAILLDPENADLRYQLGSVCLELGDFQGGFENIRMSLNLEPETTPDRFFAFAQLIPGREAVQVYEHGMKVFMESNPADNSAEIKRKVSTACCAAAEIFMTDLCDEEDAEGQCSGWLERALSADSANPEAFRVLADLQMCQQKPEEARENVLKACKLWAEDLGRLTDPTGSHENDDTINLVLEFPSYESRIAAAKILIEIGGSDLLEEAVVVLEQLLKEDDSVLMTWYLLGFTLKTCHNQSALEDAIEGALRVARRDGHLKFPELFSEDELVLEILTWAKELGMNLEDLDADADEEDEAADAVLDLEEVLAEAEKIDQQSQEIQETWNQ